MRNKYIQFVIMIIAIFLVTGVVLKIKIDKINNNSKINNQSIDSNESEGEEIIANKFLEDGEMRGVWLSTVSNLDWPEISSYKNSKVQQEMLKEKFDFIVSRAVTAFPAFVALTKKRIRENSFNDLSNGILYLKGGDFEEEIRDFKDKISIYNIPDFFEEEFFETKKLIYMKLQKRCSYEFI